VIDRRAHVAQVTAVVAQEHDVAKPGRAKAARRAFEHADEGRGRNADRAGEAEVTRGFWNVGDDGRDDGVTQYRRDA